MSKEYKRTGEKSLKQWNKKESETHNKPKHSTKKDLMFLWSKKARPFIQFLERSYYKAQAPRPHGSD